MLKKTHQGETFFSFNQTKSLFIFFWIFFSIALLVILSLYLPITEALKIVALIIVPVIPAVYLNFFLWNYFYLKGKITAFALSFILLICVFGVFAQFLADTFYNTEDNHLIVFLNPLIFILISSGIRAFRDEFRNKLKLQEYKLVKTEAEAKLNEMETLRLQSEIDLLKSQINPHFLFNTLNNIYSLALNNSSDTATAIMLLSKLMRYQIKCTKLQIVPLTEELEFIENYVDLEKLRLGRRCKVQLDISGDFTDFSIPPLLCIAVIENCFKHGIGADYTKNYICISITIEEKQFIVQTKNRIIKIEPNETGVKTGKTGLMNLSKRLALLYPDINSLDVKKNKNDFTVLLKICL